MYWKSGISHSHHSQSLHLKLMQQSWKFPNDSQCLNLRLCIVYLGSCQIFLAELYCVSKCISLVIVPFCILINKCGSGFLSSTSCICSLLQTTCFCWPILKVDRRLILSGNLILVFEVFIMSLWLSFFSGHGTLFSLANYLHTPSLFFLISNFLDDHVSLFLFVELVIVLHMSQC